MSKNHTVTLSDKQDIALGKLAIKKGKTKAQIIKESMDYNLCVLLDKEYNLYTDEIRDAELTDSERAELFSVMVNKIDELIAAR